MRDLGDRAQERIEIDLAQSLQAQRARAAAAPRLLASGCCKNPRCGEEFEGGEKKLFCGPACAREFERFIR